MKESGVARQTYRMFYQRGHPMTMCRGLTPSSMAFFYSDLPYWSDTCQGWVSQDAMPTLCAECLKLRRTGFNIHEFIEQHQAAQNPEENGTGDSHGVSRKPTKPDTTGASKVSKLHVRRKRSDQSDSPKTKTSKNQHK